LKRRIREGGRLRIGDFLLHGRYKLVTALGRGGFATIYQAFDTRARRLVAVKVLHGQHGDDKSRVQRFFRGARKMAELRLAEQRDRSDLWSAERGAVGARLPGGERYALLLW
jgi:serine/threonine protein kinase